MDPPACPGPDASDPSADPADPAARLLAPLAADLPRAWRRAFVHRPGAATWLLEQAPDLAAVDRLLAAPAVDPAVARPCVAFPAAGDPPARHLLLAAPRPLDPAEPVNLPHADAAFPALRPLARALAARYAAPVNLQLFRARCGPGLRPHRDLHDSFIIQLVGRKRWIVEDPDPEDMSYRASSSPPRYGNQGGAFGPRARALDLAPGDLLYKPSHGLHATESASDHTLSLTASIVTLTAADALARWFAAQAALDPAWSARLPLDAADRPRLAAALRDLLLPTPEDLAAAAALPEPDDDE